jgi:hypothetical protein
MIDKKFAWIRVSGNVTDAEVDALRESVADTPIDSIVVVTDEIELLTAEQVREYVRDLEAIVDD